MRFLPGSRVGPYEILAPLGSGGMGEVYRAKDSRLGREVALKTIGSALALDDERMRRFEREARAAGSLNHPNVLTIFDVGAIEGTPYLVSELLQGRSLRERLDRGRLPTGEAVPLIIQLARGLEAAHRRGIVHRDLKPENLFMTDDGRLKILDFGIAKLVRDGSGEVQATATQPGEGTGTGVLVGTARYMAPEQLRGEAVDHRVDLFATGCILYEMVAGTHPFHRSSPAETTAAILESEPSELPTGISHLAGLERVIRKSLAKRPIDRVQSAGDLAFFLEHLLETTGGATTRSEAAARVRPMRQLSFRRGIVSGARFTPDGSSVVYGASWEGNPFELFWAHSASPESRPLGLDHTDVLSISRSGEMAVLRNRLYYGGFVWTGTLARLPVAGGVPRPLAEDIMSADWSPDGRTLALVRWKDGKARLECPLGHVLYETLGWITSPRFSPDGQSIAFIDHDLAWDDSGFLAVAQLGGGVRRVTSYWSSIQGSAWSPQGESILITAARIGSSRALHRVSLDGAVQTLVQVPGVLTLQDVSNNGDALLVHGTVRSGIIAKAPDQDRERDLSWFDWSLLRSISPDGTMTLFDESGEGGGARRQVYLRRTDGSPAFQIGEGIGLDLSPDGAWALTVSLSNLSELTLAPSGIGEPRVISLGNVRCHAACLLLDARRIAVIGSEEGSELGLYVVDVESGTRTVLVPTGLSGVSPLASPDGGAILAASMDRRLWLYPAQGGEPREIRGVGKRELPMSWSADGNALYVIEPGAVPAKVYQLDIVTGKRELWMELRPPDATGIERVSRIRIASKSHAYAYTYYMLLSDLYLLEGAAA